MYTGVFTDTAMYTAVNTAVYTGREHGTHYLETAMYTAVFTERVCKLIEMLFGI